ncbi:histone deacetylase 5-like [Pyrus ussuriensis x Pyrus communis]|uniref:Histone deacetylase 5-like n=1 Tax=Pyrus ussuriensis x Pyrus communis TaxID=2448454 RepID=A0A5N5GZ20_9ROSA|nr:histone deacetylase 5-like [Pyrus ussuriensis x Pyrus communis]
MQGSPARISRTIFRISPSAEYSRNPLYQHFHQLVYIFYFFVHLFKIHSDSGLTFPSGRAIKRADVVTMVAAKKTLTPHPKNATTIVAPLVEKATTPTPVYPSPFSCCLGFNTDIARPSNPNHGLDDRGSTHHTSLPSLVRCPRWVEPPITSPLPLGKGKGVASPLGDFQLAVKAASQVNPHAAEVGPRHEAAPLVKLKVMAEIPPSWEDELDIILSSTSGTVGCSVNPAESSTLAKLHELLSLSLSAS